MKRLLVVDDFRGIREYLEELFSPYYEVSSVADGSDALSLCQLSPFDLVISDIHLPGLDGFSLYRSLRERFPHQAVVLMTDADVDELLEEAYLVKVGNIIAKPMFKADPEGVLRIIRDLHAPASFGMERFLGRGGECRSFVLTAATELDDVLAQTRSLLDQFPRYDVYHYLLPSLVHDVVARSPFSQDDSWQLKDDVRLILSVGADWQRVGLGVCAMGDPLSYEQVLSSLIQSRNAEVTPAYGVGLAYARDLMDMTLIKFEQGVRTEVLAFDLLNGYKGSHSLHTLEVPGRT